MYNNNIRKHIPTINAIYQENELTQINFPISDNEIITIFKNTVEMNKMIEKQRDECN